jgi:hypothetical protein
VITVRAVRAGEGARLRELRMRAMADVSNAFGSTPEHEEQLPEQLGVIEQSPAIPFYERLGFILTAETKPVVRDSSVLAVYMARPA